MANLKGGYQIVELKNITINENLNGENKKQFEFLRKWFDTGKKERLKPLLLYIKMNDASEYGGFTSYYIVDDFTSLHFYLIRDELKLDISVDLDVDTFDDVTIIVKVA